MNNNLIQYNKINYNRLLCDNIQGDIFNYISLQFFFMSILYVIFCVYILTYFYSEQINKNINDYIKFKEMKFKSNTFIYNTIWKIINIYSHYYIKFTNYGIVIYLNDTLSNYFKSLFFIINDKITIQIINKGDIILTLNNCDKFYKKINSLQYDFVIYKNNETQHFKIITKKDIDLYFNHNNNIFSINMSNIKFFVVCIQLYNTNTLEVEKYNINLNNYMIVDNILLTEEFIVWYLNYYYKKKYNFSSSGLSYKIEIIDQNVNKVNIHSGDCILISKNDYLIFNYNKN